MENLLLQNGKIKRSKILVKNPISNYLYTYYTVGLRDANTELFPELAYMISAIVSSGALYGFSFASGPCRNTSPRPRGKVDVGSWMRWLGVRVRYTRWRASSAA
jgi:hypothetical protein